MRKPLLRDGILVRSLSLTLAVFAFIALLTIIYSAHSIRLQASHDAHTRLQQLLDTVQSTIQIACFVKDKGLAREVANGLLSNSEIARVRIEDETGILSDMESHSRPHDSPALLELVQTIQSPFNTGEVIGKVVLYRDTDAVEQRTRTEIRERVLLLAGQLALMAAAIITTLVLLVVRPLRKISNALKDMTPEQGQRLHPPRGHTRTELGTLAEEINQLADRLVHTLDAERSLRLQREVDEMKFHAIFDNAESGIFIVDRSGQISSWNHALEYLFNLPRYQEGKPDSRLAGLPWENPELLDELIERTFADKRSCAADAAITINSHTNRWLKIILTPIADDILQGVAHDISDLKESEASAKRQAISDPLTGLLNRSGFEAQLTQRTALPKAPSSAGFSMLLIDLDKFRQITEGIGVSAGDDILRAVANRLASNIKQEDALARLSSDIFAVILDKIEHPGTLLRIAERILDKLRQPYLADSTHIELTASMGIVRYTRDGETPPALLRHAELAVDKAKLSGGNQATLFTPELAEQAEKRRQLENDLRKALGKGEFALHFQPIIDLQNKQLAGAEALIRWHHPSRGLTPPNDFIPVLEESSLINDVGQWILEAACRQLHQWEAAGRNLQLSINVSARQIPNGLTPGFIADAVIRHRIRPENLALEITEGILISSSQDALSWLAAVRHLGVKVYLDDFGTGYSSLSYLKRFPVDTLKIDRSFVLDMTEANNEHSLVEAIIAMAGSLGLSVVAEGVENLAQARELSKMGCNRAQGYYFSKPLNIDQFESCAQEIKIKLAAL